MREIAFARSALLIAAGAMSGGWVVFPASAQIQNPIKAARDAYQKAMEQQKKQASGSPAPTPAPNPAATRDSQPVTAEDLLKPESADKGGRVVDPKVMPDIMGIHLGMSARDAEAAARAQFPKGVFRAYPWTPRPVTEPMVLGFSMNLGVPGQNDQVMVDLTPGPNPAVVWRVARMTQLQRINRTTMLAALRQKYGKETLAYENGGTVPSSDDRRISRMYWFIDESGKAAPAPKVDAYSLQQGCTFVKPGPMSLNEPRFHGEPLPDALNEFPQWSASSCVGVVVTFAWSQDPEFIEGTVSAVIDVPLYLRSAEATAAWWKAAAAKARQDDIERSKQVRPKL